MAEGHEEIVKFLLEVCKVQPLPEDRWQQTPLEEATRFGHYRLAAYIKNYVQEHPEQLQAPDPDDIEDNDLEDNDDDEVENILTAAESKNLN